MRIAFSKHAVLAGLMVAFLGLLAPLIAPTAAALADTTGEGTSGSPGSATGSTTSGTPSTSAVPVSGAPEASAPETGTPESGATGAGAPALNGSITGGATPTSTPSKPTIATWFGPGLYGRMTACGQKMTPKLVGIASRTLPCGTLVRITYRGHRLTVPVLDRGPYAHNGATWDLTSGAARALKIKDTVRITTEIMGSVPNSPTLGLSQLPGPVTPAGSTVPSTTAPSAPSTAEPTASPSSATAATTGGATAG